MEILQPVESLQSHLPFLTFGRAPETEQYIIGRMKQHLQHCISTKTIDPFPTYEKHLHSSLTKKEKDRLRKQKSRSFLLTQTKETERRN